jgi:DNA-binding response OmpR family regulator
VITTFADCGDSAVHGNLEHLAKAIVRELLSELRHSAALQAIAHPDRDDEVFHVGPLTVDTVGHEASWHGQLLHLKAREFALLAFLAQNSGRVFTREQLLELVWRDAACDIESDRTVDVHVSRLRVKLGREAGALIRTIAGIGYKLQVPKEHAC